MLKLIMMFMAAFYIAWGISNQAESLHKKVLENKSKQEKCCICCQILNIEVVK